MTRESDASNGEPVWLVDPKRSPVGFWLISTGGILLLAGAVALGLQLGSTAELALAAILVTGGFLFLSVAIVLGAARGGAAWFPKKGLVSLFGRSSGDALTVPVSDLTAIAIIRRRELWGRDESPVLISSVELATRAGPTLHLLEFGSLEEAREAALMIRSALKLPVVEPAGEEPAEAPAEDAPEQETAKKAEAGPSFNETLSIGPGWGLGVAIVPSALFCLLTGALLLAGVESTGVLGFLFGPVALFTGVGLAALWTYKATGSEEIFRSPGMIEHAFTWASFRWGRNRLEFAHAGVRCRIRSRGPTGFCIEALAGTHILIFATGAGTGTRIPPERLLELAQRLEGPRR